MAKILLKNVQALLEDGSVAEKNIAIENDKIVKIGEVDTSWVPDQVLDGKDKLAIPGFINTHTHASMTLLRSYADEMCIRDRIILCILNFY